MPGYFNPDGRLRTEGYIIETSRFGFTQFEPVTASMPKTDWKFHLSINGDDLESAWNIVVDELTKDGNQHLAKVITPEKIGRFSDPDYIQAGKMITIYQNNNYTPERYKALLERIERRLAEAGIKPGPLTNADRPVPGSDYVSYRRETGPDGRPMSSQSISDANVPKEQRYNPHGSPDPYQDFNLSSAHTPVPDVPKQEQKPGVSNTPQTSAVSPDLDSTQTVAAAAPNPAQTQIATPDLTATVVMAAPVVAQAGPRLSGSDLSDSLRVAAFNAEGPEKLALLDLANNIKNSGQADFSHAELKQRIEAAGLPDSIKDAVTQKTEAMFGTGKPGGPVANAPESAPAEVRPAAVPDVPEKPAGAVSQSLQAMRDRIGATLSAAAESVQSIPGFSVLSSAFNRVSGIAGQILSNNTLSAAVIGAVAGGATYAMTGDGEQGLAAAASTIAPEATAAVVNGSGVAAVAAGAVDDAINTGISAGAGVVAAGVATAVVGGVVAPVAAAVVAGAGAGYLVGQALAFEGAEPLDRQKMQTLYSALPPANEQTSPEVYSLAVFKDAIEEARREPLADPARQEQKLKLLEDRFQDQYMALREGGQLEQVEQDVAAMAPPVAAPPAPVVTQAAPAPAAPAAPSAPVQEAAAPEAPDLNQQVAALAAAAGVPYPAIKPKPPVATTPSPG